MPNNNLSNNKKRMTRFNSPHSSKPNSTILPSNINQRINITGIKRNIDTDEILLEVTYDYLNTTYTRTVSRESLFSRSKSRELLNFGMDFFEHTAHDMHKYLSEQEKNCSPTYVHSNVGFGEFEGKTIYKHWKAHGLPSLESLYQGPLNIKPLGKYKLWKALVKKEVLGNIPLELALLFGLSAPVASLIARHTGLEVLFVHLCGDSTQGKTTAIRLAVSPFGCPDSKNGGLVRTWDSTSNGLFAQLRGIHGLPLAFDEASMHEGKFSNFVYKLASGQEKTRLNKESELKENGDWNGLVLSTAEHSLLAKSSKNNGVRMRLFEFQDITWTKSASNADNLKHGLLKNYGQAGPRFVRHLLSLEDETLLSKWNEYRKLIREKIANPDHFVDRLADKFAIILVTAWFAREALRLDFNFDKILEMLLCQIQQNSTERDLGQRSYDYFRETVTQHHSKFTEHSHEQWGALIHKDGKLKQVLVLRPIMEKLLTEGGFENCQVILKSWASKKWLDCDHGKLTRKRTLRPKGSANRLYVVNILDDAENQ
ncbi:DUF927 domain-containing protein [Tumebacillus flagellatus]|uniref:DUF927 domain-containing protein n=1 Tax=Tumebacillus flagellatus TaxID=1157490 RepID=A0A074LR48_9BACL|nr:DUF927 domain-containing protein [Tumebacillus flagellatus]KEO83564.1 hypothetical protein EL26_09120 [Tumebacillus flagellatus]